MLTLLGAGQGQNNSFDVSYQAILNYAIAQGYTLPSSSQQLKQNTLLKNLKTNGVWYKLDSFAVMATDGGTNYSLIDWKKLTQMTAVNSPVFTVNQGFKGNGTSAYINTGFIPSSLNNNYSLNNASFGYWAFSFFEADANKVNIGVRNSSSLALTYATGSNESFLILNTNNVTNTILSTSSGAIGFRHFNRINSSGSNYYNASGLVGSNTNISGALSTLPFYLFCLNSGGSPTAFSSTDMSFFFAGSSLVAENANFESSLKTYITSL